MVAANPDHPLRHADAHALPFGAEFFDAIVSVDGYQYVGTADLYLGYGLEFLKADCRIGAVMPAIFHEPDEVPAHLVPFWDWEFGCLP